MEPETVDQPAPTPSSTPTVGGASHTSRWKSPWMCVLIVVALAIAAAGGAYAYEHSKVSDLQTKNASNAAQAAKLDKLSTVQLSTITDLKTKNTSLNKQVVSLQNTLKQLSATSNTSIVQAVYNLTVGTISQYSPKAYFSPDSTDTLLLVTATVKNTSTAAGYLDPSDFTLKDSGNVKQPYYKDLSYFANTNIALTAPQPGELLAQELDGGSTATGTLIFYVAKSATSFTLTYQGKSFPITVTPQQ